MGLVPIHKEYDFNTEFPTWIIAYCPDTDSWFCTNRRFFYYEYQKEFQCEADAIEYFRNNVPDFFDISRMFHHFSRTSDVFLENIGEKWTTNIDFSKAVKLKDLCMGEFDELPWEED